ncbi:hypothetical protein BN903_45 [Halorubrum sp. AJ67]|nr:hypothetical protein BN903_45 [Halorubrum sp. AJ67]
MVVRRSIRSQSVVFAVAGPSQARCLGRRVIAADTRSRGFISGLGTKSVWNSSRGCT